MHYHGPCVDWAGATNWNKHAAEFCWMLAMGTGLLDISGMLSCGTVERLTPRYHLTVLPPDKPPLQSSEEGGEFLRSE